MAEIVAHAGRFLCHFDSDTASFVNEAGGQVGARFDSATASAASKFGSHCYSNSADAGAYHAVQFTGVPAAQGGAFTMEAFAWRSANPINSIARHIINQGSSAYWNAALQCTQTGLLRYSGHQGGVETVIINSPSAMPLNQWVHCAVCRGLDGVTRLFMDGVLVGSSATLSSYDADQRLTIGCQNSNSGRSFVGRIDEALYVLGIALYPTDATFTPPTEPYTIGPVSPAKLSSGIARIYSPDAGGPLTARSTISHARRDTIDGGAYRIAGTVAIDGTPTTPVKRRVRLFHRITGRLIREVWSATDGTFSFESIALAEYIVMSDDYTRLYNAVVADAVVPVP